MKTERVSVPDPRLVRPPVLLLSIAEAKVMALAPLSTEMAPVLFLMRPERSVVIPEPYPSVPPVKVSVPLPARALALPNWSAPAARVVKPV